MRRSRRLMRRLGAPIRSLVTSNRTQARGKGGFSGILEAHDRCLSAEQRADATEERDYAGLWSRRRDGQWGFSSAPSRACDAWSGRTGGKVGAKAGKGRGSRTENGPGPTQSRADATEDRVIRMHGRAGATKGRGQRGEWSRGCECKVVLARPTMGAIRRDGTGIRMHGRGRRFDEVARRRGRRARGTRQLESRPGEP